MPEGFHLCHVHHGKLVLRVLQIVYCGPLTSANGMMATFGFQSRSLGGGSRSPRLLTFKFLQPALDANTARQIPSKGNACGVCDSWGLPCRMSKVIASGFKMACGGLARSKRDGKQPKAIVRPAFTRIKLSYTIRIGALMKASLAQGI